MKIVVLADVHGNMEAVEALEKELERIRPDDICFLGDAVGKGPESDKAIDWAFIIITITTNCNIINMTICV